MSHLSLKKEKKHTTISCLISSYKLEFAVYSTQKHDENNIYYLIRYSHLHQLLIFCLDRMRRARDKENGKKEVEIWRTL